MSAQSKLTQGQFRRLSHVLWVVIALLASGAAAFGQELSLPQVDVAADYCESIRSGVQNPQPLVDACNFVLSLTEHLPNVICDQKTSRYVRPAPGIFDERLIDIVTAHVIYEDGVERYSDIKINGQPSPQSINHLAGQSTRGEFGTDLMFAFSSQNHPLYRYLREEKVSGRPSFVYEARIAHENNRSWTVHTATRLTYPEYVADIWVDQANHKILRLDLNLIPQLDFPLSDIEVHTDYRNLPLGDGTRFVLPVKSRSSSCLWDDLKRKIVSCTANVLVFNNCHKFGATSRILTDGTNNSQK